MVVTMFCSMITEASDASILDVRFSSSSCEMHSMMPIKEAFVCAHFSPGQFQAFGSQAAAVCYHSRSARVP